MNRAAWVAAAVVAVCSPSAWADGELLRLITAKDTARLAQYDELRSQALARAGSAGAGPDGVVLLAAMGGGRLPVREGFDPRGDWQCRIGRVGPTVAPTVYRWFRCRITEDDLGLSVEKRDGTERMAGRLFDWSETLWVFLGAVAQPGETPRRYGEDARRDRVAYVMRPDADRLRIEFPASGEQGEFEVLELRRAPPTAPGAGSRAPSR